MIYNNKHKNSENSSQTAMLSKFQTYDNTIYSKLDQLVSRFDDETTSAEEVRRILDHKLHGKSLSSELNNIRNAE